ncbi:flagellar protein FlgN [Thioclava atlantica]|uniref:FlgN-like protein n=1 Tax=Thioclava atlantica TaxID=1317124 RepID=A0A085TTN4_9RHOB|nr:flagellar protein FlgN [Thioclava atlantica]KFE34081.1 hypothetical protein DW2_15215 [Thioclava atlantica]
MQSETATEELVAVLRSEREAIRRADFGALATLVEQKRKAISDLDAKGAEVLRRIGQEAAANEHLLMAAMHGIRAAQGRLEAALSAARGFDAYDSGGNKQVIRSGGGRFERRA